MMSLAEAVTQVINQHRKKIMSDDYNTDHLSAAELKLIKAFRRKDTPVEYRGKAITLPDEPGRMPIPVAIDVLTAVDEQERREFKIREKIDGFPFDALIALTRVLNREFGLMTAVGREVDTFFGPMKVEPELITIETGPGKTEQVYLSRFPLPSLEGYLEPSFAPDGMWLRGKCPHRNAYLVADLVAKVKKEVRENSIYRGKALVFKTDEDGEVNPYTPPEFIDTSKTKAGDLVLPEGVMAQVVGSVFTPIEYTDRCRRFGVPLKRGVLFSGHYGTGKTMTASVTAQKCEANNWTFLLVNNKDHLASALDFAKRYSPAVVFFEDVDRAVKSERDESVNEILNTIDGVIGKDAEVITVMTTNHVENINKAMLRPGRLDAVIQFIPPDAKAAATLVRQYSRGLIDATAAEYKKIGKALAGQIPAVIREVVERAKLYSIPASNGDTIVLTAQAILDAASGMKDHLTLLNGEPKREPTAGEMLENGLQRSLNGGLLTPKDREVLNHVKNMIS